MRSFCRKGGVVEVATPTYFCPSLNTVIAFRLLSLLTYTWLIIVDVITMRRTDITKPQTQSVELGRVADTSKISISPSAPAARWPPTENDA